MNKLGAIAVVGGIAAVWGLGPAWARFLVAGLLGLFSLLGILVNWSIVLRWYMQRVRASQVPLVGGLAGCIAMSVCPWTPLHPWAWVPLVADPGCGWMLPSAVLAWLQHRRTVRAGERP